MVENKFPISAIQLFQPISLQQLDSVKLMNRVDQKFILKLDELNALFLEILESYYVLEIDSKRTFRYSSLYYDTNNFNFYTDHHNGKPNRVKVRSRYYLDTETAFFEIKKKINEDESESIHFIPEAAFVHTRCPKCGSPDFEITAGRGVSITQIKGEI